MRTAVSLCLQLLHRYSGSAEEISAGRNKVLLNITHWCVKYVGLFLLHLKDVSVSRSASAFMLDTRFFFILTSCGSRRFTYSNLKSICIFFNVKRVNNSISNPEVTIKKTIIYIQFHPCNHDSCPCKPSGDYDYNSFNKLKKPCRVVADKLSHPVVKLLLHFWIRTKFGM